ncbi:hypothetical protein DM01DRAFT_1334593 [Hesseltinella vesiculosa]|uniref:GST N-terminal domain-containing protein n=1 Tax=Hesseltinella vesiculosa TaxID=101127 RepID=A0A1X2GMA4_9FUNG|nr:hypothetical protein DM01DRAFT_1334593 [Hesseltinella vesiculosa]
MAKVTIYDLMIAEPDQPVSPFSARTRISLNIKGIPQETKWLAYFDLHDQVPKITKLDKRPLVPVIEDGFHGNHVVDDSFNIARYLDEAFPDTPKLFDPEHEGQLRFLEQFVLVNLIEPSLKLTILNLVKDLRTQEEKDWFRKDRETKFGITLEEFAGKEQDAIAHLQTSAALFDHTLRLSPFLNGQKIGYLDVIVAAAYAPLKLGRPDVFEAALLDVVPGSDAIRQWWIRLEPFTAL